MAPSQLKRLKASLHEQRQSKTAKGGPPLKRKRSTTAPTPQEKAYALRQQVLLPEIQRRHKVGGIIDRRIGENDPTVAPEERMLRRFAAENQRSKRSSIFNLEDVEDNDDGDEDEMLTHGGKTLHTADGKMIDDYDDEPSDEDPDAPDRAKKIKRLEDAAQVLARADENNGERRSKKEIMEEVMAKSKLFKHERQQAREDDDIMRDELDQGLPDILKLLGAKLKEKPPLSAPSPKTNGDAVNSDRAALMSINDRSKYEKEYDQRVKQMAEEQRAQPTERTKTAEEQAEAEANRLRALEAGRLRRMQAGEESEEERASPDEFMEDDENDHDDAATFGFDAPKSVQAALEMPDEDDFLIDDDLVEDGSDIDIDPSDLEGAEQGSNPDDDDDAEFLQDVLTTGAKVTTSTPTKDLAYTYPCPQSHSELVKLFSSIPIVDINTVIKRIRTLYHPSLHSSNKTKLSNFASALVTHITYLPCQTPPPPLNLLEEIIRHIHSLCRVDDHALAVSSTIRTHLTTMHTSGISTPGHLSILTAIATIFPPSDHFHQVVTPALTLISAWLGMHTVPLPSTRVQALHGAYLATLTTRYQVRAARILPETVRYTIAALSSPKHLALAPSLLESHLHTLSSLTTLYASTSAFQELFTPALPILTKIAPKQSATLASQLSRPRLPLALHHHRPLPVKTSAPLFEDTQAFHPGKTYDPDADRAASARLRKEHGRERRGALKELRRDAEFVAREKLSVRKEADKAYKEKERRILGTVASEEGRGKNEYEREREGRKRGRGGRGRGRGR